MYEGYERDFGMPSRIRVSSIEKLSGLIDDFEGTHPCFLSISYYKENTPYMRYIPFDFDGEEERVLRDSRKLIKDFEERDIPYTLKLSGNRGAHVVLDLGFNPDKPEFISPKIMRDIQMTCMERNKLETTDYHLIGNVNAMLRIPGTLHEKSKRYCTIIREVGETISLSDLCKRLDVTEYEYKFSNNFVGKEAIHPYPCLEYFVQVPNPLNYCRVAFAIYRLKQGIGTEDIFDEMEKFDWIDWKPKKTKYHLGKIAKKGYSMPSCKKVESFGLGLDCENCKYNDARILKFIRHLER